MILLPAIPSAVAAAAAWPSAWAGVRVLGAQTGLARRPLDQTLLTAVLGALFVWASLIIRDPTMLGASLLLATVLAVLAAIDARAWRLPDVLTLPLALAGLGITLLKPEEAIQAHLAGAALGYALLAGLAWLFRVLRKRDGLGLGDAKLMAAAGAWLGWRPLPTVILLACAGALLMAGVAVLIRGRRALGEPLPFGIPLSGAFWIVWLYGAPG